MSSVDALSHELSLFYIVLIVYLHVKFVDTVYHIYAKVKKKKVKKDLSCTIMQERFKLHYYALKLHKLIEVIGQTVPQILHLWTSALLCILIVDMHYGACTFLCPYVYVILFSDTYPINFHGHGDGGLWSLVFSNII